MNNDIEFKNENLDIDNKKDTDTENEKNNKNENIIDNSNKKNSKKEDDIEGLENWNNKDHNVGGNNKEENDQIEGDFKEINQDNKKDINEIELDKLEINDDNDTKHIEFDNDKLKVKKSVYNSKDISMKSRENNSLNDEALSSEILKKRDKNSLNVYNLEAESLKSNKTINNENSKISIDPESLKSNRTIHNEKSKITIEDESSNLNEFQEIKEIDNISDKKEDIIKVKNDEIKLIEYLFNNNKTKLNFNDSKYSNFSLDFEKYIKQMKLITNIQKYDFQTFLNENLNKIKVSNYNLTQEEILSYSEIFIDSLTNLNKNDKKLSKEIHKNLFNYLIKADNINLIKFHLNKIIKIGLLNKDIKKEIFLQFIKFSNIKKIDLKIKVIQGFNILLSFLKIESSYIFNVLNYIYNKILVESDSRIVELYKYCFVNIIENKTKENRLIIPSNEQIQNLIAFEKIEVKIYFSDKKYLLVYLELFTTVKELKEIIFNIFELNINDFDRYCIYESFENTVKTEEIIVEDFIRVSDIIGSWNHEITSNNYFTQKTNNENNKLNFNHKLYFRKRYYNHTNLEYSDIIFNFLECIRISQDNRLKLNSEDLKIFLIIYLKINFNKYDKNKYNEYEIFLNKYLSSKNIFEVINIKKYIFDKFQNTNKDLILELLLEFNNNLCLYNFHLCQYYNTILPEEVALDYKHLPYNINLWINPKHILLLNNKYKNLQTLLYSSIKNIYLNENYLFINYICNNKNNNQLTLLILQSFNSSIIMKTIENYINLTIGNGISSNTQNFEEFKDNQFNKNLIESEEKYFKNINTFYK